ncbi:MAG TPA: LysR family transcriptional regulator [Acidimicrobiales bacterium]|nr:LysR family transcriptional regulator [Acidimicrobiales bacterium]
MDLRRLTYFLAVVDEGGFTSAAKAVFVSQPALSLAIKELEHELGTELFERLGRSVRLTAAGQALVGPARQVLRDLETGKAAVEAVAGLRGGTLSLASLPTLAAHPVAELVGRFCRRYPDVAVDLSAPEDTADLVDLLRTGQCELGIGEETGLPDDLRIVSMEVQRLLVILPPGSPVKARSARSAGSSPSAASSGSVGSSPSAGSSRSAASRSTGPSWLAGSLRLGDLRDTTMIATPIGTSSRRLFEEGFAAAGVVPRVSVVTAQRDAILPLVLAGAGASLVPEAMAAMGARLGAVVAEPRPAVERRIVVAARQGPLAPAARGFLGMVEEGGDSTRSA